MPKQILLRVHKTPYFWAYWIAGIIAVLVAVMIAPLWEGTGVFWRDYGRTAIDILLCVAIFLYVIMYLVREASREGLTSVRILLIIEIAVLVLIAVGCVLKQLAIIKVGGAAEVIGVAIWLRGAVLAYRSYFSKSYTIFHLALAIGLITLGTVLVVRPLFTAIQLRYIVAVAVLVFGITLMVLGVLCKPKAKKK